VRHWPANPQPVNRTRSPKKTVMCRECLCVHRAFTPGGSAAPPPNRLPKRLFGCVGHRLGGQRNLGHLWMSDLLTLQPNLDIKLYLVAPEERRTKVEQEILRPTFSLRDRPLPEVCGFLSFSTFMAKVEGIHKLRIASSLKPDFLEHTAEFFAHAEEEADP
jgi:hypothetical protein